MIGIGNMEKMVDVVTRVSQYNLDKNKARLEIVTGLIKAIAKLDDVIVIIKKSKR